MAIVVKSYNLSMLHRDGVIYCAEYSSFYLIVVKNGQFDHSIFFEDGRMNN